VIGGTFSGVLFTSRLNRCCPLESNQSYCHSLSNDSSTASVADLFNQNHGIGYETDITILVPQYPETYLDWLLTFGFVLLFLVGMITYGFVKHKAKR